MSFRSQTIGPCLRHARGPDAALLRRTSVQSGAARVRRGAPGQKMRLVGLGEKSKFCQLKSARVCLRTSKQKAVQNEACVSQLVVPRQLTRTTNILCAPARISGVQVPCLHVQTKPENTRPCTRLTHARRPRSTVRGETGSPTPATGDEKRRDRAAATAAQTRPITYMRSHRAACCRKPTIVHLHIHPARAVHPIPRRLRDKARNVHSTSSSSSSSTPLRTRPYPPPHFFFVFPSMTTVSS